MNWSKQLLGSLSHAENQKVSLHPDPIDPTYIPILVHGGIGDVITAIDSIQFLMSRYSCIVYCSHKSVFEYFAPEITPIWPMPTHTWHLAFDSITRFEFHSGMPKFLIKEHKELYIQHLEFIKTVPNLEKLCKYFNKSYYTMASIAEQMGWDKRTAPLQMLGFGYVATHGIPMRGGSKKRIITVHDGFDTQNSLHVDGRSTKQWRMSHWNDLVSRLKRRYHGYVIIQIGALTSRVIEEVDECWVNRTTLSEVFDILKESSLHIDGDSGLVHAAWRLGTRSAVLWGSTPMSFYGYHNNVNIRSNACGDYCFWLKESWMTKCPIGLPSPVCMDAITPDQVLEEIEKAKTL